MWTSREGTEVLPGTSSKLKKSLKKNAKSPWHRGRKVVYYSRPSLEKGKTPKQDLYAKSNGRDCPT